MPMVAVVWWMCATVFVFISLCDLFCILFDCWVVGVLGYFDLLWLLGFVCFVFVFVVMILF